MTPHQEHQLQCHENAMFREAETMPEDHQPLDFPLRCPSCNSELHENCNRHYKCGAHYPWPQEGEGFIMSRTQCCYALECEEKAGTIIALETSLDALKRLLKSTTDERYITVGELTQERKKRGAMALELYDQRMEIKSLTAKRDSLLKVFGEDAMRPYKALVMDSASDDVTAEHSAKLAYEMELTWEKARKEAL